MSAYSIQPSESGRWFGVYLNGALVATFDSWFEARAYVDAKCEVQS